MASGSTKVIYAALAGNSLIAVTKFVAAAMTGSSAMFSEGIHSLVDTGNQGLLLFGMRRAARPADDIHPFGYGREIYFWSFVVAILIFAVGAGFSLYEGIQKLDSPHALESPWINYLVLSFAIIFEGAALWFAVREFNKARGDRGWFEAVRHSKDPALFTVLFEDSAAMLGLVVALAGVALSQAFHAPVFDAIASIVIGLILASAAILLAVETKALLIGEAASPAVTASIRAMAQGDPRVKRINELLTIHHGPQDVLCTISLDFRDHCTAAEIEAVITNLERRIKTTHREVTRVFVEAQAWSAHQAAGLPSNGH